MAVHPNVTFKINSGKPSTFSGLDANYFVKGEMKLLGSSHPLEFPAKVTFTGNTMKIIASFTFNQSIWGMNYHLDPSYPEADRILPGVEVDFDLTARSQ